jgi:hypothetical protein
LAATWSKLAYEGDVMLNTVADANSVLYAVSDDTPAALAMAASTMVARLASGNVVAATVAEILTLLSVESGATADAKATGAELDTGTDDAKFATAKALKDSHNIPSVVPGTATNVLTSDGTDWVSSAAGAPAAHDILSASHGDTVADAATDGDIIIGNATPKWSALAIDAPAATFINILGVANAETRPSWKGLFDATVPGTIGVSDSASAGTAVVAARRDHVHASPATFPPTSHALSNHTAAVANLNIGGYEAQNLTIHQVADNTALLALDEVVGKLAFRIDTGAAYILTALSA